MLSVTCTICIDALVTLVAVIVLIDMLLFGGLCLVKIFLLGWSEVSVLALTRLTVSEVSATLSKSVVV
jgi:hypothetical protein